MTDYSTLDLSDLLQELEQSGLTVAQFARNHGIPAHRLYWARRRAREANSALSETDFHAVRIPAASSLSADDATTGIELRLPNDCKITLRPGFDEVTLQRLLALVTPC